MRIELEQRTCDDDVVVLATELAPSQTPAVVRYSTGTGALARLDGRVEGAFDREHLEIEIAPSPQPRELTLEVERHSLPTNLLPSGQGLRWRWMNRRTNGMPSRTLAIEAASPPPAQGGEERGDVTLWGHSHLDVAWLWTYAQTRRKAMRTFANAAALLAFDNDFVFMQSQPQLYEFVREEDTEFFARITELVRAGRFDPDIAAMWVEPDCNVPSGESLLRQMLAAQRYCAERFGIEPSIAWLPDTFGFARTLPTLLAHSGIPYFATTKLKWNDTTDFPHPQFVWRGPDGGEVVSACIERMEGECSLLRARVARERDEPMVVGYGDGGGGPTRPQLARAPRIGRWERPGQWFERLAARRETLPVYDDELYLEYHRGVYTTHHDVKMQNASLERRLAEAEEQAAWCVAVRAPGDALARVRAALHDAWTIVLRNQFHDVLPGTSIAEVYADARAEYERAHELVDMALAGARAMLPRAALPPSEPGCNAPAMHDDAYVFENDRAIARVLPTGALVELSHKDGRRNVVAQANLLALYRDRPSKWEAWNLDAGYERSRTAAKPQSPSVVAGKLEIPFDAGRSRATMQMSLLDGEPFLRVEFVVDWRERQRLLRLENWLAVATDRVVYGAPHGCVTRSTRNETPQERAKFEVPGQRFAAVRDGDGAGLAVLALDTYGWSARTLERGGVHLGHSLLRGTTWPDPDADLGEQRFSWAFAPLHAGSEIGEIERMWLAFAGCGGVRLFTSDKAAVQVAACKPAHDGDGVVLRLRECNGGERTFNVRCGGRMREVSSVDGLERPIAGDVRIDGESLVGTIGSFALRSFRVRF
jgi:alpha-mannosidase